MFLMLVRLMISSRHHVAHSLSSGPVSVSMSKPPIILLHVRSACIWPKDSLSDRRPVTMLGQGSNSGG